MILCDKHLIESLKIPVSGVPTVALLAIGLMQLVDPSDYQGDLVELQYAIEDEGNCPLCYAEIYSLPLLNWAKSNYSKFYIEGDTVEYTFQE